MEKLIILINILYCQSFHIYTLHKTRGAIINHYNTIEYNKYPTPQISPRLILLLFVNNYACFFYKLNIKRIKTLKSYLII